MCLSMLCPTTPHQWAMMEINLYGEDSAPIYIVSHLFWGDLITGFGANDVLIGVKSPPWPTIAWFTSLHFLLKCLWCIQLWNQNFLSYGVAMESGLNVVYIVIPFWFHTQRLNQRLQNSYSKHLQEHVPVPVLQQMENTKTWPILQESHSVTDVIFLYWHRNNQPQTSWLFDF